MNSTFWKITRTTLAVVIPIILVTVGIRAADNITALPGSLMASLSTGSAGDSRCSAGMVFVQNDAGGFCIDKYEASPSKECVYENPSSAEESRTNINVPECVPVSKKGVIPWRNISQNQAQQACRKADKRLPSNSEWYQASLGIPDPFNIEISQHPCVLGKSGNAPALTGSKEKCVSPSGVYDAIGNAWEWVEGTIYDGEYGGRGLPQEGYVAAVDSEGVPVMTSESPEKIYYHDYFWVNHEGPRAMFRGGYWGNDTRAGVYAIHAIGAPNFWTTGVGFRCVQ